MTIDPLAAFIAALPRDGRLLGLDVGSKTIGLATSDALRGMATPLSTIARTKFTKDAVKLAEIIRKEAVVGLVIGLPLNMDGSEGPRCQSTRQFVANLAGLAPQAGVRFADLPVLLQDERLSSAAVERTMVDEYDMSRARRAERIDAAAAAWILQTALERMRNASPQPA
ncbi:MAG: Holliday junction resolvase RuvX [Reyranellaceae bacterium]